MNDSRNMYAVFEARVRKFDPVTKVATVVMPGVYGMEPFEAPPFTRSGMDPAVIEDLVVGDRVLVVQGENEVPEWLSTNPDWYRAADTRYVNATGDTMTGDLTINSPYDLNFQSTTRQMINLYTGAYGIGVQSSALYFRCNTNSDFVWHNGGVHSNTNEDPGAGGTERMVLRPDGLYLTDTNDDRYFCIGNSTTSGARLVMSVPFIGSSVFIDYMGWGAAGSESLAFRSGNLQTVLELGNSVINANKPIYATGQMRLQGGTQGLILTDGGAGPYIGFYDGLSVASIGARQGYVGMVSGDMYLNNESGANTRILSGTGVVLFVTGPSERARIDTGGILLIGKTGNTTYYTDAGVDIRPVGQILCTTDTLNTYPWMVRIGAALAVGQRFLSFRTAVSGTGAEIGTITIGPTVSGTLYNTSSHGPFKGNVVDLDDDEAIERLMKWRPVAYQWKYDENGLQSEDGEPQGEVQHGFIAQEMNEINPSVVTPGTATWADHLAWRVRHERFVASAMVLSEWEAARDANPDDDHGPRPGVIDDPGDSPFTPWMGDWTGLVPDVAAAMQALVRQVRSLVGEMRSLRSEVDELRRSAPNN